MTSSLVVPAYRRALERIYTLIGREFGLIVVAIDHETSGSGVGARELTLVARSMSTETPTVSSGSTRHIIRGPVVRIDLSSSSSTPPAAVSLKASDIREAFAGRSLPIGTPLVVAFVGADPASIKSLAMMEGDCAGGGGEKEDLRTTATGGYLVLSITTSAGTQAPLPLLNLCEKKAAPERTQQRVVATPASLLPKFLVGTEVIDTTRSLAYAIRVIPEVVCRPTPSADAAGGVPRAPTARSARETRWKAQFPPPQVGGGGQKIFSPAPRQQQQQCPSAAPVLTSSITPEWERLVAATVERELNRLHPPTPSKIELGDGLVARVWPQLLSTIAGARDWHAVFTHQSVDPTPRVNYEAFETLGDKVLSLSLVHYLFSNSREMSRMLDSNGLTDSHKEILSSVRQAAMATTMGLNKKGLIRSTISVDDKMLEDVYEAFFGCLFTVANRVADSANQGLPLCELLFKYVLHESFPELDPWSVPKDPQTTLDQVFIRLGWGHPLLSYNEETKVTVVRLTRDAHNYLETIGPPIRGGDQPLAVGPRASDKSTSARAAAELALSTLKMNWGIDTHYASLVVRSRLMNDERYASVQRKALKIAKRLGFTDVYVARRAKNHNQLYAVIGVRPDNSECQLHIYKYDNATMINEDEGSSGVGNFSTRIAAYVTALRGFISARSGSSDVECEREPRHF